MHFPLHSCILVITEKSSMDNSEWTPSSSLTISSVCSNVGHVETLMRPEVLLWCHEGSPFSIMRNRIRVRYYELEHDLNLGFILVAGAREGTLQSRNVLLSNSSVCNTHKMSHSTNDEYVLDLIAPVVGSPVDQVPVAAVINLVTHCQRKNGRCKYYVFKLFLSYCKHLCLVIAWYS